MDLRHDTQLVSLIVNWLNSLQWKRNAAQAACKNR
jgi:hypothetical protein